MIGRQLGPYAIREQLGAGGMGEVYLAEDTRLGRQVAVKVLPPAFAADAERLARFEQEARAAAALNHPNIAALFDVGQVPGVDGGAATHYMVQEYLRGQTLREALKAGALPTARALGLAIEIAEALKAAHRAGIVHRDLKPENVFVTEDGHAKVLDFGLAKLTEVSRIEGGDATMSPTVLGTVAGTIMGTAGYMAPEQIEGTVEIDRRADLFSFGCVLYEMAGGRRAFAGSSIHETLHMIGHSEPAALGELGASLPPELQRILSKALAKDRNLRYQHADDLVVDLRLLSRAVESGSASIDPVAASTTASSGPARALVWALGAVALASLAVALWLGLRDAGPPAAPELARLSLMLPSEVAVRASEGNMFDVSADGQRIVVRAAVEGDFALFQRSLQDDEFSLIPGTENGRSPELSPDGRWVAFDSGRSRQLHKVSLVTGALVPLGPTFGVLPLGISWGSRGDVLAAYGSNLYRYREDGETPRPLGPRVEDTGDHLLHPAFLPSGRQALVEISSVAFGTSVSTVGVIDIETGELTRLEVQGSSPRYLATGHLMYAIDGRVTVVPFDLDTLQVTGEPAPVAEPIMTDEWGLVYAAVSDDGNLLYIPEDMLRGGDLVWVSRDGAQRRILSEGMETPSPGDPRISPDGHRIAYSDRFQIWVYDLPSETASLISLPGVSVYPVWVGNTSRVLYTASRGGPLEIVTRLADSSETEQLVFSTENALRTVSWVAARNELLYREETREGGMDVMAAALDDVGSPRPILTGSYDEMTPTVSPDGRWLAYMTDETGRDEIWMTGYPEPGRRVQVSQDGGREPVWHPRGDRLYYWRGHQLFEARIAAEPNLRVVDREFVLEGSFARYRWHAQYDIHPDGERFVMIAGREVDPRMNVVLGWSRSLPEPGATSR